MRKTYLIIAFLNNILYTLLRCNLDAQKYILLV